MDDARREIGAPSPFFAACHDALRASAAIGPTLDLACGRGRHALAAAALGLEVLAVDRNAEHLAQLRRAAAPGDRIETREIDLEAGAAPDLGIARFGAVLVFRYLHRPLAPWIESLLTPGGILLYETFTTAQRERGWGPSRDAFLLAPGELPTLFPNLEPLRFEEGPTDERKPAETARLLARRPLHPDASPAD